MGGRMIFRKDFDKYADEVLEDLPEETVALHEPVHVEEHLPQEFMEKTGTTVLSPKPVGVFYNASITRPVGLIVTAGGDYVMDSGFIGRLDVLERNSPYFYWSNKALKDEPVDFPHPACPLISVWSSNYFHWIAELLPRLRAVELYQFITDADVMVLVEEHPPAFVAESLSLLGITPCYLRDTHIVTPTALAPAASRERGRTSPTAIRWVRDKICSAVEKAAPPLGKAAGRRIYISRAGASSRRVDNEGELIRELRACGFEEVRPEQLPFDEQVRLFRGADTVVAPHGAGSINAIFGRGPTNLIELFSPSYINPCNWTLMAAAVAHSDLHRAGRYGLVVGESAPGGHIKISIEKVMRVLEAVHVLD